MTVHRALLFYSRWAMGEARNSYVWDLFGDMNHWGWAFLSEDESGYFDLIYTILWPITICNFIFWGYFWPFINFN